jgi:hypothetical protein
MEGSPDHREGSPSIDGPRHHPPTLDVGITSNDDVQTIGQKERSSENHLEKNTEISNRISNGKEDIPVSNLPHSSPAVPTSVQSGSLILQINSSSNPVLAENHFNKSYASATNHLETAKPPQVPSPSEQTVRDSSNQRMVPREWVNIVVPARDCYRLLVVPSTSMSASRVRATFGTQHQYYFPPGKRSFFISFATDQEKQAMLYKPPNVPRVTLEIVSIPLPGCGTLPDFPIFFSAFGDASREQITKYLAELVGDQVSVQRMESTFAIVCIKNAECRHRLVTEHRLSQMPNGCFPVAQIPYAESPFRLYVTNIDWQIKDYELREFLWTHGHGDVTHVEIARESTDKSKGFGFIRVRTLEAGLNLLVFFKQGAGTIRGRTMRAAAARNPFSNKNLPRAQEKVKAKQSSQLQRPIPRVPSGYNAWNERSKPTAPITSKTLNSVTSTASLVTKQTESTVSPQLNMVSLHAIVVPPSTSDTNQLPTLPERQPLISTGTPSSEALALTRQEILALLQMIDEAKQRVQVLYLSLNQMASQIGLSTPNSDALIQNPSIYSAEERQEIIQQAQDQLREQLEREESQHSRFQSRRHQRHQQQSQQHQPQRTSSRLKEQRQQQLSNEFEEDTQTVLSNSNFSRLDRQQRQQPQKGSSSHIFGREVESQKVFAQPRSTSKGQLPKFVLMEVPKSPAKNTSVSMSQPSLSIPQQSSAVNSSISTPSTEQ